MDKELKAKQWALEAATLVFFAVALAGIRAGAEAYAATARAAVAGLVVAFAARLPARILLDALQPPPEPEGQEGEEPPERPTTPRRERAGGAPEAR